ncbi:hypothetical protein OHA21_25780 [Actinoplanes sp. NBC_00393]|uniref:hypothetical protein n=1 Tax=Actinoplanes sp. NBC_00393 TaxID=2975953 RepID=UPI002E1C7054
MEFWDKLTQPQAVLTAAAIGALGAIIGAFLANLFGQWINARSSSRRQWDDARHKSYAKVAETFYLLWDGFDSRGRSALTAERAEARSTDFLAAYSAAALITKKRATSAALDTMLAAAQRLWHNPSADWPAVDQACHAAHAGFQRAAREEFGVRKHRPAAYTAPPVPRPAPAAEQAP